MGMPITVEIVGSKKLSENISTVFEYFKAVDERFSTYKPKSEISKINHGLPQQKWSAEMREVMELCEQTKQETNGFFDIKKSDGSLDPSGLVKGWSIWNAANMLLESGIQDFYVEAGGDIQLHGRNPESQPWKIGVRNPFNSDENVKIISATNIGVATSGTYIRGLHIYNPKKYDAKIEDVESMTVIGPNIYEADRFATAAFAMGTKGINFIEKLPGFEAYMIHSDKIATMTSGFERYIAQ